MTGVMVSFGRILTENVFYMVMDLRTDIYIKGGNMKWESRRMPERGQRQTFESGWQFAPWEMYLDV